VSTPKNQKTKQANHKTWQVYYVYDLDKVDDQHPYGKSVGKYIIVDKVKNYLILFFFNFKITDTEIPVQQKFGLKYIAIKRFITQRNRKND